MKKSQVIKEYYQKIGRKGGRSKSEAKIAASRRNGKKGGAPKLKENP